METLSEKIHYFCTSSDRGMVICRLLVVSLIGIMAYSNTFNMPFIFDDHENIVNNPVVREFSFNRIKQAFNSRRAVGLISFQLNYLLSGDKVTGYHVTNLLIHLAAAIMTYFLATLIMATPYWKSVSSEQLRKMPVPFFVALFFAVHPVQTQAVTYIVQRYSSLATLFYLTTIVCYLNARLSSHRAISGYCWFMVTGIFALLAFYTKEIAYTLPAAILLVELLFLRFSYKNLIVPAAILIFSVIGILLKLGMGKVPLAQVFSAVADASRVQTITARTDYLFTQFKVVIIYIRLLFLPVNQSVEYDIQLSHNFFELKVISAFLVLLALFIVSLWLIKRSKADRPHLRLIAFGILWFFITLSIESSILPIIDLIFEHRVYLPFFGAITAMVTVALCLSWENENRQKAICVLLMLTALVLTGATWKRNLVWKDGVALWEDTTAKYPENARAWNNLGGEYIKRLEARKALGALIRSIELDRSRAAAWNNLGIAIDLMGVYKERFHRTNEMFTDPRAVEGESVNSWLGEVNNNLGLAYEIMGNLPKASENYRNAVGYNPALAIAYYNLGLVSVALKDYEKYVEQLQILSLINPGMSEQLRLRAGIAGTGR